MPEFSLKMPNTKGMTALTPGFATAVFASDIAEETEGPVTVVGHAHGGAVAYNVAAFALDSRDAIVKLSDRDPGSTLSQTVAKPINLLAAA